jgi:hypothetical protein
MKRRDYIYYSLYIHIIEKKDIILFYSTIELKMNSSTEFVTT